MAVRSAVEADADAIARVCVRARRAGYRAFMRPDQLDGVPEAVRAELWQRRLRAGATRWFVLVSADPEVAGYGMVFAPSCDADADARVAELAALYVDPDAWGRGVGTALVTRALDGLRERRFSELTVWTLADNARAVAFSRRLGFTPDGHRFDDPTTGLPTMRLRRPVAIRRWRQRLRRDSLV